MVDSARFRDEDGEYPPAAAADRGRPLPFEDREAHLSRLGATADAFLSAVCWSHEALVDVLDDPDEAGDDVATSRGRKRGRPAAPVALRTAPFSLRVTGTERDLLRLAAATAAPDLSPAAWARVILVEAARHILAGAGAGAPAPKARRQG